MMSAFKRFTAFDRYKARIVWDTVTGQIETAARLLAKSTDWSTWKPGKDTVLCLDRSQFSKDIDELRIHTHYNWVTIRASALKRSLEGWVSPEDRIQTFFTGFLEDRSRHLREPLERFGVAFLKAVQQQHSISAVMAGNTDYWQDDAIKLGCLKLGIPFLVLCRENYITALDYKNITTLMADGKFKFSGKGVAVFSEATRNTLEATKSFPKDGIWITGAPRYDRWREVTIQPAEKRRYVILASYAHPLYLAPQNFVEVAKVFCEASLSAPEGFEYLIKVKKPSDGDIVKAAVPDIHKYPVKIVWTEPIYELFPLAAAVIGFNSMAVLEAYLGPIPAIVPCWADAVRDSDETLISHSNPDDAAVTYFPKSGDELLKMIRQAEQGKLPTLGTREQQLACFRRHIAFSDHDLSSTLVERFIDHYVKLSPKA
jgi:hypothetical protein